jgi:ABC-type glutathione transport system ATPase component
MKVVEVQSLSKSFRVKEWPQGCKGLARRLARPRRRDVPAVDDISFSVEQGEQFAFIGPNGAGKSTTLKMLTDMNGTKLRPVWDSSSSRRDRKIQPRVSTRLKPWASMKPTTLSRPAGKFFLLFLIHFGRRLTTPHLFGFGA